eukprot:scaffold625_cov324-Pavlova_lutheri.AAC.18
MAPTSLGAASLAAGCALAFVIGHNASREARKGVDGPLNSFFGGAVAGGALGRFQHGGSRAHGMASAFWCGAFACGVHAGADWLRIKKRAERALERAGLLEREHETIERGRDEADVERFVWPKWLPIRPVTEEEAKTIRNEYEEGEFRRRLEGDRDRPH